MKQILSQRDEEINALKQKLSFIEEMKAEIAHLQSDLAEKNNQGHNDIVSSKTVLTDLQQRAESAEKNLREIKALYSQLDAQNANLRNICYDNVSKFDDKIERLETSNSHLAGELLEEKARNRGLSLQLRDMRIESLARTSELEKQLSYSKQLIQVLEQKNQRFLDIINSADDSLQSLKNLAKET